MIDATDALDALRRLGDADGAAAMANYHKVPREYLGVPVPRIEPLVKDWRADATVAERVALAHDLWASDIHEARLAATKLLTQARIRDDEPKVWQEFLTWVPDFDAWALADHACKVCERRLVAHPARLLAVEVWTRDSNKWVRRAALVATLPWSKLANPGPADRAIRERVLGWAAAYVADRDWFIQKSIAWWLRSLSVRDPARVLSFLNGPGRDLKAFARNDAARLIEVRPTTT